MGEQLTESDVKKIQEEIEPDLLLIDFVSKRGKSTGRLEREL